MTFLIDRNGSIDRAAVEARALEIAGRVLRVPVLELGDCVVSVERRFTPAEAAAIACRTAELELAADLAVREGERALDAEALATSEVFGHDLAALRTERDLEFWGQAWDRKRRVAVLNRALVVARARRFAKGESR